MDFDRLVTEANERPIDGWDFSFLDGRATEQRTPWGYATRVAYRLGEVDDVLDVDTGGGEVFAQILDDAVAPPRRAVATESYPPNAARAASRLARRRGLVVQSAGDGALPFAAGSFDLVTTRHPVHTNFDELARVLRRDGAVITQQVAPGSNRALYEFLMGPQTTTLDRDPDRTVRRAELAGFDVIERCEASLEVHFFDVGAVVYFLRLVPWTVPDFALNRYVGELRRLHDVISENGEFSSRAERYLLELRRR